MISLNKLFSIFLFLTISTSYAHKDRIERPVRYRFIFANNETIDFNNPTDSQVEILSNEIINHKRNLTEVQISFKLGEVLTLIYGGNNWTSIKISFKDKVMSVPQSEIQKIPQIHFETVALLWDGNDREAFTASYCYIQFDVGVDRKFKKFDCLRLFFEKKQFSKAKISKQIDKGTSQETAF